jgi:hypothetical protein
MDEFWRIVGAVAAVSAVWTPLVVWLTKSLVQHGIAKDLEHFKAELAEKNERLRSELALVVKEREIAYGALVAKRASGLVDLFTAIDNAYGAASVACLAASAKARAANVSFRELDEARGLYRANLLYVDTELSRRIEELFRSVSTSATVEPSNAAAHATDMKAQRDAIEAAFRVLLGSELSPPTR